MSPVSEMFVLSSQTKANDLLSEIKSTANIFGNQEKPVSGSFGTLMVTTVV